MPSRPVVLVTGAARRIGRSIALELAAHGHDVAVHTRDARDDAEVAAEDLRRAGATAEVFVADLADEAACRGLVPAVLRHFQRLDAVVNNASLFEYDDVGSFGHAAMEAHWRVNTAAAILLAQALHAHLAGDTRSGCVVNLLDQKLWNPNPDHLSYTLSKAALAEATTALALALAPRVRVCGVAPGVTLPSGAMTDAEFAAAHRLTPLERSSTPEDIAQAVRFLIEASAVTGTTLLVDGGQHLWGQPRDVAYLVAPQAPGR
jgi:NAD(P)-dependent dehydrogenase (short-subunit alcohol dehydrogenase family)